MSARDERVEAAAVQIDAPRYTNCSSKNLAIAALAASDAVLRSPEAVERVNIAISAHEVITDGITEPSGWCPACGLTIDDVTWDMHQARAVIAALLGGEQG